jgi:hypothetical protein
MLEFGLAIFLGIETADIGFRLGIVVPPGFYLGGGTLCESEFVIQILRVPVSLGKNLGSLKRHFLHCGEKSKCVNQSPFDSVKY